MSNIVPFTNDAHPDLTSPAMTMEQKWWLAQTIASTEFVPGALRRRPEAVLAAMLTGSALGLDGMTSLRSIHVIDGRPTLSAEAMRALVFAHGHTIDIIESTSQKATVSGRRAGSNSTATFTWTLDRARRAQLANKANWRNYPEQMLLARASAELCRALFPDVLAGLTVTEELQDELEEPAAVTRRQPPRRRTVPAAAEISPAEAGVAAPPPPPPPSTSTAAVELDHIPGADQTPWSTSSQTEPAARPHDPDLAKRIHAMVAKAFPMADANTPTRDRWRHALVAVVTRKRPDGPATSSSDLDLEEQLALSELLTKIQARQASVADGPDDTIELRAGGGWRYTITLDPPAVTVARGETAGTPGPPAEAVDEPADVGETSPASAGTQPILKEAP